MRKCNKHILWLLAMTPLVGNAQNSGDGKGIFSGITPADVTATAKLTMPQKWTFTDCMNYAIANSQCHRHG